MPLFWDSKSKFANERLSFVNEKLQIVQDKTMNHAANNKYA